jgi:pseudaminic acid cytidylyltransferase
MKIAVIPARGGSKRIPRKNIKIFDGFPMISYAIKAALGTQLFDHVIVSTDDEEIAQVSRSFGANVPFKRPKELSNDHTTTAPVIDHAIDWLATHGINVDSACCIYPCVPFLTSQDLLNAHQLFLSKNAEYVYPIAAFHSSPWRAMVKSTEGQMQFIMPENELTRTQDLSTCYYDAGMFYWGKATAWTSGLKMHSNGYGYEIDSKFVIDIDTFDDWLLAEKMTRIARKALA